MACRVLRCTAPVRHVLSVNPDPEAPAFEAGVCDEHSARIEAGDPWRWSDQDDRILMGTDLDSGGELVFDSWEYVEEIGHSVLVLHCHSPSGAAREPMRLVMAPEQLAAFVRSFRYLLPHVIQPE
jgi:hypothetical protein